MIKSAAEQQQQQQAYQTTAVGGYQPEAGVHSQESQMSGGTSAGTGSGRMLPAQPIAASRSLEHSSAARSAKLARERMKIRSSTWTEEATHYASEESGGGGSAGGGGGGGRYLPGRRRQPAIPSTAAAGLIKRPSSAGVLMTPSGTATTSSTGTITQRPFAYATKGTVGGIGSFQQPLGYSTHPQPRRITPPVPLARARRAMVHQQHSFHSDTGASGGGREGAGGVDEDDDDDDEDWC